MIDVQNSLFQVTKTLKMNIIKHSTIKCRTDDSFKIWIWHVCTIALSNHHGRTRQWNFTHHNTNINFQSTKSLLYYFHTYEKKNYKQICLQRSGC